RAAISAGRHPLDVETYLALREITIYFEPWLALWEVLGGYVLDADQRALVAPVFDHANRWQALENDRVSVTRDFRNGTPNLVALVAASQRCSLTEATTVIRVRAARELAAYIRAMATVRASAPAAPIIRYLATLEAAVEGATRHHRGADPARYDV
ncbi:MAG: hypothetical protein ABI678_31205, partial [Kofleriaceae bacterium]